jgi:DHA1 family bicyclomycin/chloramphenicol resistance-like MFS transporter
MLFFTLLMIDILAGAEVDLFIPSFPELQALFHLSPFLVQFMLSANLSVYCVCSLFAGALGDRYNRRTIMLSSLYILVLGSILCVVANTYPILLAGRVLQGIGMAGSMILVFPILLETFPAEKQAAKMGVLNGASNLALAAAPVIGSYVSLFFGWRGNFVVLLLLSVFCLIAGYFVFPNRPGNPKVSLSLTSYWPLFRSSKLLLFTAFFCFMASAYWVFIGMAPILYMQDLGVSLKNFGYYQGSIACAFGITSLVSPMLLTRFGHAKCFHTGVWITVSSVIMFACLFHTQHPLLITLAAVIMAIGTLFPVNIMFPQALNTIEHASGKANAFIMSTRLILTALTLAIVSYFYQGEFFLIGLSMVFFLVVSLGCIVILVWKKWLTL